MQFTSKLIAFLTVLSFLADSALAQSSDRDQRDFWMLNNTGRVVVRAFISPHNVGSWGPDSLGSNDVLGDENGMLITFNSDMPTSCVFDFRLVFDAGDVQEYLGGINLCKYRAVEFDDQTAVPF